MASLRLIKGRIRSTKNIAQITKAMQMVAASKMKKAQEIAVSGKPYVEKIYEAVQELSKHSEKDIHPLFREGNKKGDTLVILISTNKGLCGGLNANLFRKVAQWFLPYESVKYITVGKKGENYIVRNKKGLLADFSETVPFVASVPALSQLVVDGFLSGQYKEVYCVYNLFENALKQVPTKKMIIPITDFSLEKGEEKSMQDEKFSEFIVEPAPEQVLDALLPFYIENQIRASILEAAASEYSAQMIAMKNATDAAMDLTSELTLIFNKIRQEKITYEIADMVTARATVAN
ncbi:ATP synthase F1 subunit gamma [Candidatus Gottesmanbacteria bacterium RIFCSPHIGHO2_02_FULL_39_11]|uniref:ATP synthase gamma chain n=1 Tax=Candidatus Gottesmanbacteria bacterium RIFCSPHIGHO2_02_FULL_39_11 TaxID=1798382 RepID=A0A1F5ZVX4_9BACT|nr:MAG: ATP synthase F1 subunit gamma [Candidatus Gottesmanbacteria bacterium RIFCSPHIGHO2_02_FULL_39_11]